MSRYSKYRRHMRWEVGGSSRPDVSLQTPSGFTFFFQCATCHVYLAQAGLLPDTIPPVSEAEEDMLEYVLFRTDASRLSCQLRVTKGLGEWCTHGNVIKLPKH